MDINKRSDYHEKWIMHVFEVSAKKLKEMRHRMMLKDLEQVMDEIIEERNSCED